MEITKGIQKVPIRTVIYGQEKIGKSTLASNFPNPVFIDTEDGTMNLDVSRAPKPQSWTALLGTIDSLNKNQQGFKTLVIDSVDWAQALCVQHILAAHPKDGVALNSIEELGYGRGYVYLAEEFGRLLTALTELTKATGMHIVVVCHAAIRKFELPEEGGTYDRWELKLERRPASGTSVQAIVKEWADLLLFASYKTMVIEQESGKKKASGEKRVLRTQHTAVWDGGNRYNLKPEIPMVWESLEHLFSDTTVAQAPKPKAKPTPATKKQEAPAPAQEQKPKLPDTAVQEKTLAQLRQLMEAAGVTDVDVQQVIGTPTDKRPAFFPPDTPLFQLPEEFVAGMLIPKWKGLLKSIKKQKETANA